MSRSASQELWAGMTGPSLDDRIRAIFPNRTLKKTRSAPFRINRTSGILETRSTSTLFFGAGSSVPAAAILDRRFERKSCDATTLTHRPTGNQ